MLFSGPACREDTEPTLRLNQRFVSVERAAELLECSDVTIRRRIRERRFPALKIGSRALIPLAFIELVLSDALAGKTVVLDEYVASWSAVA